LDRAQKTEPPTISAAAWGSALLSTLCIGSISFLFGTIAISDSTKCDDVSARLIRQRSTRKTKPEKEIFPFDYMYFH
jgi:hypothetical protein